MQWHGTQDGVGTLPTQKVQVTKPWLRRKGRGKGAEVEILAYTAMQHSARLREKLTVILLRGVITRAYAEVIVAVCVDSQGYKHMLGLAEGVTENAVVVKGLQEDQVARVSLHRNTLPVYHRWVEGVKCGGDGRIRDRHPGTTVPSA